MSLNETVIEETLKPDGTLELDEKLIPTPTNGALQIVPPSSMPIAVAVGSGLNELRA